MEADVWAVILRAAGAVLVDAGVAIANAIAAGDVAAVEQLTQHCPTSDQILASAAALKRKQQIEAERHFAALNPGDLPKGPPALSPIEWRALRELNRLDPEAQERVLLALRQS